MSLIVIRKTIISLSIFLTFAIQSAEVKQSDPQRQRRVIEIQIDNQSNAGSATTTDSFSGASNTSKQYVVEHKHDFGVVSSLSDLLAKTQSLQPSFPVSKFKICALSLLSSYALTAYKLHLVHELLESHDAWCNWKEVVALSHLISSPYEDTIKQLQIDTAKRYFILSTNQSNQDAHVTFLKEVQEEISLLKNYLWWSSAIKTLHCSGCFYMVDACVIQEKLARLNFMIDIFIRWQVEHAG
ncbi:MAG: hypothetical protein NTZ68_01800 [Candidatus Dependentiae bacterium]|nr:hypothetical protein [Candidatus Dependentiae bacterium]